MHTSSIWNPVAKWNIGDEHRRQDKNLMSLRVWVFVLAYTSTNGSCDGVRCGKQIRLHHFCKVNHMWTMMSEFFSFFLVFYFRHSSESRCCTTNNMIMRQWFYVLKKMCSILVFPQKYQRRKYSFRKLIYVGRVRFSLLFNLPVVSLYLYHFMASRMFRIHFDERFIFHTSTKININQLHSRSTHTYRGIHIDWKWNVTDCWKFNSLKTNSWNRDEAKTKKCDIFAHNNDIHLA